MSDRTRSRWRTPATANPARGPRPAQRVGRPQERGAAGASVGGAVDSSGGVATPGRLGQGNRRKTAYNAICFCGLGAKRAKSGFPGSGGASPAQGSFAGRIRLPFRHCVAAQPESGALRPKRKRPPNNPLGGRR